MAGRTDVMSEEKIIRQFVIKRFIIAFLCAFVVMYLLTTLNTKIFSYIIMPAFFPELISVNLLSLSNIVSLFSVLGILLLSHLIGQIFPLASDNIFTFGTNAMNRLSIFNDHNHQLNGAMDIYSLISPTRWAILALIFLVFLILSLIPLIVAMLFFIKAITGELNALENTRLEKERSLERSKYLMISDIAHDLKTPMTTVSGYAQALSQGMVPEDKIPEYLDSIVTKSGRMNEVIQILFEYVKLESEGYSLTTTDLDICELLRDLVASLYIDMEEAGDIPEIDIPEEKIMIQADCLQLQRVFFNILGNAIKHNDKGTQIGIFLKRDHEKIRVFISDNGNAIPNDLVKRLFDPFVTGDESRLTKNGTGLGLAISYKIAGLHGYSLRLVQKPEIGRYHLGDDYTKAFILSIPVKR